ncbi:hypothetical protein [Actinoplanes sp. TFC3]|uniref:hypothetical protein n=1 Tax=Actinoplanes sp. TFC3 TaxID=1710355 RepID=UPI00082FB520|nr:hypothetical protein [Actinoplanes sp. TFC3]
MTRPESRITFANNGPWGAYSQREMARWATDEKNGPLWIRVLFAALGRHNSTGHAPFGVGELARILGRTEERLDSVSGALRTAKKRGFIHPASNARCIVLPHHTFQKASRDRPPCRVHRATWSD